MSINGSSMRLRCSKSRPRSDRERSRRSSPSSLIPRQLLDWLYHLSSNRRTFWGGSHPRHLPTGRCTKLGLPLVSLYLLPPNIPKGGISPEEKVIRLISGKILIRDFNLQVILLALIVCVILIDAIIISLHCYVIVKCLTISCRILRYLNKTQWLYLQNIILWYFLRVLGYALCLHYSTESVVEHI